MRLIPGATLIAVLTATAPAYGQTVSWYRFDPLVIPSTYTQPVLLEAAVTGSPTRVNLELSATTAIEMRDDGTGGDRSARDGVFTASVPAATILSLLRADDVQRVFVGFLNVFNGATTTLRGNMFADVYTPEIGTRQITRVSADVQATARVVNIADSAFLTDLNVRRLAQAFYRMFGDDFDFLNIITTPTRFANRTHTNVRNDVRGIGLLVFDSSSEYGSAGRLRGYTMFPVPGLYDGAGQGYSHETGHQWINFLQFTPFNTGVPHWPVSSMATGVMGFSIGGAGGQGGDFRCDVADDGSTIRLLAVPLSESPVFGDFDLYLMGLMPPEAVRPQVVLTGVASPPQCSGQTYTGTVTRVGISSIVSTAGARVPDAAASPKRFRAATILVSRDGLVSQETMWLYTWFTERAELESRTAIHEGFLKATGNPFYVATGGRASIDTLLASSPDFSLRPDAAARTVLRGSSATFRISAIPTRASFDQPVSFSCGSVPAPLSCAFSPAELTPGTGADVTLTVRTAASAEGESTALVLLLLATAAAFRQRRTVAAVAAVLALATACGGSKSPTTPTTPGTPSSTIYTITVNGTSGSLTRSTVLTLTVQ